MSWPLTSLAGLPHAESSLRALLGLALFVALGKKARSFVDHRASFFDTAPACAMVLTGLLLATHGYGLAAPLLVWTVIVVEELPRAPFAGLRRSSTLIGSVAIVAAWAYPRIHEAAEVRLVPFGTVIPFDETTRVPPPPPLRRDPSLRDQFPHVLRRIMQRVPHKAPSGHAPPPAD